MPSGVYQLQTILVMEEPYKRCLTFLQTYPKADVILIFHIAKRMEITFWFLNAERVIQEVKYEVAAYRKKVILLNIWHSVVPSD